MRAEGMSTEDSDWPTTRSFPRTTGDAFRDSAYASPVEHYSRPSPIREALWFIGSIALVVVAYLVASAFYSMRHPT